MAHFLRHCNFYRSQLLCREPAAGFARGRLLPCLRRLAASEALFFLIGAGSPYVSLQFRGTVSFTDPLSNVPVDVVKGMTAGVAIPVPVKFESRNRSLLGRTAAAAELEALASARGEGDISPLLLC